MSSLVWVLVCKFSILAYSNSTILIVPTISLTSFLFPLLLVYSGVTVGLLSQHNHLNPILAKVYFTICALALASHAKTTFTDPGAIPQSAVPVDVYTPTAHAMCSRCQSYKPKGAHHCRICDRCISGMDHHCPWMNNCVGTGNMSKFGKVQIG